MIAAILARFAFVLGAFVVGAHANVSPSAHDGPPLTPEQMYARSVRAMRDAPQPAFVTFRKNVTGRNFTAKCTSNDIAISPHHGDFNASYDVSYRSSDGSALSVPLAARVSPSALAPSDAQTASLVTIDEVERANVYGRAAQSPRTRHEYARDWAQFATWCEEKNLAQLPADPTTIALYVSALADAGRSVATIRRAIAGISHAHAVAGFDSSTGHKAIRDVMRGIARTLGAPKARRRHLRLTCSPPSS